MTNTILKLQSVIADRDAEIKFLRSRLNEQSVSYVPNSCSSEEKANALNQSEIMRYSRQLILPEIGVNGQIKLKNAAVLIVGAGGLGCPVGLYLSAAGVGKIGIIDHDFVDVSNLHRQISHTEASVGENKCTSFARAIRNINSLVKCEEYAFLVTSNNIEGIIEQYDVIVDATDNVPSRYLLNDAAVLYKKPLVSGSALRFEGQLTVYNYQDGPCYRCLFPAPPNPHAITNCSEGGVLGAVTGVIGSLQALEVIKIVVGLEPSYFKKMLLFDGLSGDTRVIKLRNKKSDCEVCGNKPSISKLIDYELFCNTSATDKDNNILLLSDDHRISCSEYKNISENNTIHILVDVRPVNEMSICQLPNSLNIPLNELSSEDSISVLKNLIDEKGCENNYVVCRRGNDSQKAVLILQKYFDKHIWRDIKGGLYAWHDKIDSTFPLY